MFKLFGKKPSKKGSLGQESSFYYNEKLKRWVERGKEDEAAKEAELPPPPTTLGKSFSHQSLLSDPGPASHGSTTGRSICEDSDSAPPAGPPVFQTKRALLNQRYVSTFNSSSSSRSSTPTNMFPSTSAASKPKPTNIFIPSPVVSSNNLAAQDSTEPSVTEKTANEAISKSVSEQSQFDDVQAATSSSPEEPEQTEQVPDSDEPTVQECDVDGTLESATMDPEHYQSDVQQSVDDASSGTAAIASIALGDSESLDPEGATAATITHEADLQGYSYDNWYNSQKSDATAMATSEGSTAVYQYDWSLWGPYENWTQEQRDYYAYCQYYSSAQPQVVESNVAVTEASEQTQVQTSVVDDTADLLESNVVDDSAVAAPVTEDVEILQSTFEEEEAVESGTPVFTEIPLTGESHGLSAANGTCMDEDSASSHDGSALSDQSGYDGKNESGLFAPLNWIKQKTSQSQGKLVGMPWDNVGAVDYDQYWKGTDDDFLHQPETELPSGINAKDSVLAPAAALPEAQSKQTSFGLLSAPLFSSLQPSGIDGVSDTPIMSVSASLARPPDAFDQFVPGKAAPATSTDIISFTSLSKESILASNGPAVPEATPTSSHPLPDVDMEGAAVWDSTEAVAHAALETTATEATPMKAEDSAAHRVPDPRVEAANSIVETVADPMVDAVPISNERIKDTEMPPDDAVTMPLVLATEEQVERPSWPGANGWDYIEGADYSKYYYTPDFSAWGDYSTWDAEKVQIYWEWYYGCQYYQHQLAQQAASEQGLSIEASAENVVQDTAASGAGPASNAAPETVQEAASNVTSVQVSRVASEQEAVAVPGQNVAAVPEQHDMPAQGQEQAEYGQGTAYEQEDDTMPHYTSAMTSYEMAYAGYGPPQAAGDPSTSRAGPASHNSHCGRMPLPERHTFDDMPVDDMEESYSPDLTQQSAAVLKPQPVDGWNADITDGWDNDVADLNTDGWDLDPAMAASGHAGAVSDGDGPASTLSPLRRHSSCSVQVANTPQPPHTPPRDDHATSPAYIDEDIVPPTPTRIVEDAPAPTSSIPTPSTSSTSGVPISNTTQTGPLPVSRTETSTPSQPSTSGAAHMTSTCSASTSACGLPPLAPSHNDAPATSHVHHSTETMLPLPAATPASTAGADSHDDAEDFFNQLARGDSEPAVASVQPEPSHSDPATSAPGIHQQVGPSSSDFEPHAYAVNSTVVSSVISPASGLAAATEEELEFFDQLGADQNETETDVVASDPFSSTSVFASAVTESAAAVGSSLAFDANVAEPAQAHAEDDRPEPSSLSATTPQLSSQLDAAQFAHQKLLDATFNDPAAFFSGLLGSEQDSTDVPAALGPDTADNVLVSAQGSDPASSVPASGAQATITQHHMSADTLSTALNLPAPQESSVDASNAASAIAGSSTVAEGLHLHECASPSSIMATIAQPTITDLPASSHHDPETLDAALPAGTSTAGPSSPSSQYAISTASTTAVSNAPADDLASNTAVAVAVASNSAADATAAAGASAVTADASAHADSSSTAAAGAATVATSDDGASSSFDAAAASTTTPQSYLFDWSQNPRPDWSLWGPRETWGPDCQAMYDDWVRWRKDQRRRRQCVAGKTPRSQVHSSAHTSNATTPEHSAAGAETVSTITSTAAVSVASPAPEHEPAASSSRDSAGTSSSITSPESACVQHAAHAEFVRSGAQEESVPFESVPSVVPEPVIPDASELAAPDSVGQAAMGQVSAVLQESAALLDLGPTQEHDIAPTAAAQMLPSALAVESSTKEAALSEPTDVWAQLEASEQELQRELEADDVWGAADDADEQAAQQIVAEVAGSHSAPAAVEDDLSPEDAFFDQVAAIADNAADGYGESVVAVAATDGVAVTAAAEDSEAAEGAELDVEARLSVYNEKLERFVQEREVLTDECLNLMDLGVEDIELPDEKDNDAVQELMSNLGKASAQVELLLKFCRDNGLDGEAFLRQNDMWE